jgi:FkbM family methyltransferase
MLKGLIRFLMPTGYVNRGAFIMTTRTNGAIPETVIETLRLWPRRSPLSRHEQFERTDLASARIGFLCYLARVVQLYGVDCIVDVGANEGQFAMSARKAGFMGAIYSFEPQSEPFRILSNRAAADPNWFVQQIGASSESSTATINLFRDSSLASISTLNANGRDILGSGGQRTGTQDVELKPLDIFLEDFGKYKSVMLKTDTQGHDLEVLAGAEALLGAARVVLCEGSLQPIYETQCNLAAIKSFLSERGFLEARTFPVADDQNLLPIEVDQFFFNSRYMPHSKGNGH